MSVQVRKQNWPAFLYEETHTLESVLKPSKQPKKDTGKGDNSVKTECLLFVSGGKTAMVLEFEE